MAPQAVPAGLFSGGIRQQLRLTQVIDWPTQDVMPSNFMR
jgi:hypothetical protein